LPYLHPLVYTAQAGDSLTLRRNGANLELLRNGVVVVTQELARTTGVSILSGVSDDLILTIDDRFGGAYFLRDGIRFQDPSHLNQVGILLPDGANVVDRHVNDILINGIQLVILNHNVQTVTIQGSASDRANFFDSGSFTATPAYCMAVGESLAPVRVVAAGF